MQERCPHHGLIGHTRAALQAPPSAVFAMLLHVPAVLDADTVARFRQALEGADWIDGRKTAGSQGAQVKRNLQLAPESPLAAELGQLVVNALMRQPQFFSAALPRKFLPPYFNRYEGGGHYGFHVDGAIRSSPGNFNDVRTDVSCTLFLCEPNEYDGGELVVQDTYGEHEVKLPAGDAIVYPSTSLHQVLPVTRGVRLASFMWLQSLVRDDARRAQLFELDQAIESLRARLGECPETLTLGNHYHNLLRQWAET